MNYKLFEHENIELLNESINRFMVENDIFEQDIISDDLTFQNNKFIFCLRLSGKW